ncbi:MAG: DNA-binding MarR family transcriptional regulator [Paracoccaceae bacterium]|jgi:DNA-binding MarR family transcriptional regulator
MQKHNSENRILAELIGHLWRIGSGDGIVCGLTSAQWTALRYFAQANRFSRTVSSFAEFHATTRGTASQLIKGLVSQGYLTRTRSETDGRSVWLDIADKARAVLRHDPFKSLVEAAGILPSGARGQLTAKLERMLGHLANKRGKHRFGVCPPCTHLGCEKESTDYECRLLNQPLEQAELTQICVNFEPGDGSTAKPSRGSEAPR